MAYCYQVSIPNPQIIINTVFGIVLFQAVFRCTLNHLARRGNQVFGFAAVANGGGVIFSANFATLFLVVGAIHLKSIVNVPCFANNYSRIAKIRNGKHILISVFWVEKVNNTVEVHIGNNVTVFAARLQNKAECYYCKYKRAVHFLFLLI
jgi:hypothetical protein